MVTSDKELQTSGVGIATNATFYGLSTDSKPADNVGNGSCFIEMDSGKSYLFDVENSEWIEQSGGSGGGGDNNNMSVDFIIWNTDSSGGLKIIGDFEATFNKIQSGIPAIGIYVNGNVLSENIPQSGNVSSVVYANSIVGTIDDGVIAFVISQSYYIWTSDGEILPD